MVAVVDDYVYAAIFSVFMDAIFGGGDVSVTNETINQEAAPPVGAPAPPIGQGAQDVPIGPGSTIPPDGVGPIIGGQQALENAIQQAAAAGVLTGQGAPAGGELEPTPTPGKKEEQKTAQKTKKEPPSLGDILAAIPEALNSPVVAQLFAARQPPTVLDQSAVSAQGAPPAGLVGNFAQVHQPFDIGSLLASLPGVR